MTELLEQTIILKNGSILLDPKFGIVRDNSEVVIRNGVTESIGFNNPPQNGTDHVERGEDRALVIDCTNCLIMPGLINAHTHAAMSLFRGFADDLPLETWLQKYIFPAEGACVNPEFVYLGTRIAAAEMVLSGTTTFADGYFFMEESARASQEVGIRSVCAQGILDFGVPDCEPGRWQQRLDRFLKNCPQHELITPAIFIHSPYTCSPETFREAVAVARQNGLRIFSHISETAGEVANHKEKYGMSPIRHLETLDVLGDDFTIVHAVHIDSDDISVLKTTGTSVVHCPECNMKLASGISPVSELLANDVCVAIGTDGPASNNNLDIIEEIRTASLLAKLSQNNPEALGAREVVKMATVSGAKALGLRNSFGVIEQGSSADMIVIDLSKPHLSPVFDPISHLVFAARGSDVRDVIIDGKLVVSNGMLTTINLGSLLEEARSFSCNILKSIT